MIVYQKRGPWRSRVNEKVNSNFKRTPGLKTLGFLFVVRIRMEFDTEDIYKVEHSEGFILTDEQFKKLIESKVERNKALYSLDKVRERRENLS